METLSDKLEEWSKGGKSFSELREDVKEFIKKLFEEVERICCIEEEHDCNCEHNINRAINKLAGDKLI